MNPLFTGVVLATAFALGTGCRYDPKINDGDLKCSLAGECPAGYECRNNACFSSNTQDAGLGGDALAPALLNRYIGDWKLDVTASVTTRCDNNYKDTTPLNPNGTEPPMTITAGMAGVSDLVSIWLCTLGLRLDGSGAHLHDADPTCSNSSADPVQAWTATRFDVFAPNMQTATHTAAYTRVDTYANGDVVNCNQTVTATLTKVKN